MWIHKFLSSFDHDLDSGLARIRAKTLGVADPKVSLGAGRVRIFQDGKLTGSKEEPGNNTRRIAVVKAKPDNEQDA